MIDVDSIIQWLQGLPPLGIYAALWFTTYIENIFPPSPSDVVLLFIATLIGIGTVEFVPALTVATLGSVMGFLTAYFLGRGFGRKLVASGRLPFLTQKSLHKVDVWFAKYGYGVIIANRFLAGTRAVISFFAGIANLDIAKTTILGGLSALVWNALVIWLGATLGKNWERGKDILGQYGMWVTIALAAIIAFFVVRHFVKKKRAREKGAEEEEAEEL